MALPSYIWNCGSDTLSIGLHCGIRYTYHFVEFDTHDTNIHLCNSTFLLVYQMHFGYLITIYAVTVFSVAYFWASPNKESSNSLIHWLSNRLAFGLSQIFIIKRVHSDSLVYAEVHLALNPPHPLSSAVQVFCPVLGFCFTVGLCMHLNAHSASLLHK